MKIQAHLQYTSEHLWVEAAEDGSWRAGITDYAQDLLGDIVYVEPPAVGSHITAGTPCGLVESVKTGSDLHAPLSGRVLAINEALQGTPELINDHPYTAWIFTIQADASPAKLLTAAEYQKLLGDL